MLAISVLALPVQAKTIMTSPVRYIDPHQMALGGAGVALVRGAETVYSNPAGLVDCGTHFNFPILPLGLTNATFQQGTELSDTIAELNDALGYIDSDKTKANDKFKKLVPATLLLAGSIPFGYTGTSPWPGFGSHVAFSGYGAGWTHIALKNPVSPYLEYEGHFDAVFGLSFARKIEDIQKIIPQVQDMSVGYTIKRISRTTLYDVEKDSETQKLTILDVLNEDTRFGYAETSGWGVDIGFMGAADTWIGKGKWGLTGYNIGANLDGISSIVTTDDGEVEAGTGEVHLQVPITARFGFAVENNFVSSVTGGFFTSPTTMVIDYDIVYPTRSFAKRFHAGLDQPVTDWFSFQLGLNQGFGTGGIQFTWPVYRLSIAYFTEELGEEVGLDPHSYIVANAGLLF